MLSKRVLPNAPVLMLVTLLGIVIFLRDTHPENVRLSMFVTLSGMIMFFKDSQSVNM